jgi:hypothetical protein
VPVRVALLDLPQMLRAIVEDILDQADDVTVTEAPANDDADVVILGAHEDELPAAGRAQLERRPTAKVLTINGHGRNAYLYELRPHKTPLGEISADTLLAAVRSQRGGEG